MNRLIEVLCITAAVVCLACGGGGDNDDDPADIASDTGIMDLTADMSSVDVAVEDVPAVDTDPVEDVSQQEYIPFEVAADVAGEDLMQVDEIPLPFCGDGEVDEDEECDDGNNDPDDGCDEECMLEGVDPCGDGVCDKEAGECQDCSEDCGNCCGDDVCDDFEDCEFCPADCGGCAGDAFCTLEGSGEAELLCSVSVAASSAGEPKATGIQFNFSFDTAKVSFDRFHDTFCAGPDQCLDWDIPPQNSLQPSGHTVASQEVGAGAVKVLIFHGTQPATEVSDAHLEGELLQGEAEIMEIVFKVQGLGVGETTDIEVYDMKATDKDASPMTMELKGALFVTSP